MLRIPQSCSKLARFLSGLLPQQERNAADDDGIESFGAIIRQGLLVIFLFFGVLGGWAFVGKISGAVVVPGTIKIATQRKTVQHLEGGIVDNILVREGDQVKKGQPLIELQSATVSSGVDMARKRLVMFLAERSRYQAEKDLFTPIIWSDELLALVEHYNSQGVLLSESKTFAARQASFQSQQDLLSSQAQQLSSQIDGMKEELAAETAIISTLVEELTSKRKLVALKYLEKSQVLELERQLATHQGNRGKLRQNIAASEQQKYGLMLQKESLSLKTAEEAAAQITGLDSRILQTREELRPLEDAEKRLCISAPVDGRIVGLQVHSPGGVIAPGQALMDIVPEDSPLVAEVHIPVDKITDVYVGQAAQAQLDAFDRQTTPLVDAKVVHIAADRQEEQTPMGAMPFYMSYVQLFPESIKSGDIYLSPGMPVTAFITTQKKTIIYYILEPLIKSWDRALRD